MSRQTHRGILFGMMLLALLGRCPLGQAQGQLINGNRTLVGTLNYCVDTGSANSYACNLAPPLPAYLPGAFYSFKAAHANTGASTLGLNGLGGAAITKIAAGSIATALAANDIRVGQIVVVYFDGTQFQLVSQPGSGLLPHDGTGLVAAADGTTAFELQLYNATTATVALKANGNSILAGGNLRVGAGGTPAGTLDVQGTLYLSGPGGTAAGDYALCWNSSTQQVRYGITCGSSTSAVKEAIAPLSQGMALVRQLQPVTFRFKSGFYHGQASIGFLAEQVDQVTPRLVARDEDGKPYAVRYDLLSVLLTKALQELEARVQALEARVQALEAR